MAYNYEADRLRKVQEMIMRRNNKTPDGIGIPKFDPNLDKDIKMARPKEIDPNMSDRMGAPLSVMPDDSPIIYMVAPGTGYGPQGNRFGGSTAENKALNLAYQGQGSESAKQAMRNDPGTVDFYLDMAKEVQRKEAIKPMDQRNLPPQRKVSVGQLLGKGG